MKNVLPWMFACCLIVSACGPSEEEQKAAQAEHEQRLNEIIEDFHADHAAPVQEADSTTTDSVVVDSTATAEG